MTQIEILEGHSDESRAAFKPVRDWCWSARERSWALRGLSCFHRADVARLVARSEELIARSRRRRMRIVEEHQPGAPESGLE